MMNIHEIQETDIDMNAAKDDKNADGVIRTTVPLAKDDYRIVRIAAAYLGQSAAQFMAMAIVERAKQEMETRGAPS